MTTSSPGSYQGVAINPGTDAQVAQQISAIDAKKAGNATTPSGAVVNPTTGALVSVPSTTPPTNAGAVNTLPQPQLPNTTMSSGNTSNATASNVGVSATLDALQKQEADRAAAAKTQADSLQSTQDQNKSFLASLVSGASTTADTRAAAYAKIGIDPATYFADQKTKIAEIDSLNKEYNSIKEQADAQKAALFGKGEGITMDFLNNEAAQIDRNAAPKLNELSANINSKAAVLQSLQGNFNEAKSFVDQAVTDATADTKFKVDTLTTFYQMNQDSINRLDSVYKDALNNSIALATQAHDENVTNKKAIGDMILNNPQAGIAMTDTVDQAYAKAAAKPGNALDNAYKQAQISSLNANTQKTINDINNPGGTTVPANYKGEFQATVDLVSNTGQTKDQRTQISNTMKNFITNGDYGSAYALVQQQTASSLKGAASTKFSNQTNSLGVLNDLQTSLQALSNAGYDTNKLTGTADQIQTKIGALMTDPKYASVATTLTQVFQNYRLQMTGAAFGAQESAEYAAVLPSPGNTLSLNMAKINGAKAYLDSSVNATIKGQFGDGAVNIKDRATLPATTATPPAVVKSNGVDLSTFFK